MSMRLNPATALQIFCEAGRNLTPLEFAALLATPPALWNEAADEIDPRLQKANLAN
jgi:hypothetical protein